MQDVVLDGAHNADGIKEFIRTVQSVESRKPVSLLFSAVVEKEHEKMIRTICESVHPISIVVTQVGGARVVPAKELAEEFPGYEIHMDPLSLSVACHIGPGSLALTWMKKMDV